MQPSSNVFIKIRATIAILTNTKEGCWKMNSKFVVVGFVNIFFVRMLVLNVARVVATGNVAVVYEKILVVVKLLDSLYNPFFVYVWVLDSQRKTRS